MEGIRVGLPQNMYFIHQLVFFFSKHDFYGFCPSDSLPDPAVGGSKKLLQKLSFVTALKKELENEDQE